jgi:hypothetical protein
MTALLHLLVRQNNDSDPILIPVPVPIPVPAAPDGIRHAKPVIAFIIGLSIIILASVLNAAGLNLTKLDHVLASSPYLWRPHELIATRLQVRTRAIPKSARKRDWLRPLWLLGMLLYM